MKISKIPLNIPDIKDQFIIPVLLQGGLIDCFNVEQSSSEFYFGGEKVDLIMKIEYCQKLSFIQPAMLQIDEVFPFVFQILIKVFNIIIVLADIIIFI